MWHMQLCGVHIGVILFLFQDIIYIEMDFDFKQTLENYINAWKSVKNKIL